MCINHPLVCTVQWIHSP